MSRKTVLNLFQELMAIEILFFLSATDQKNIPIQMKNAGKTRTKTPNPRGGTPPVQAMMMIGKVARTITRNGVINSGRGGQPVSYLKKGFLSE